MSGAFAPVSSTRASAIALLGLAIGLVTYPVFLVVLLYIALTSIPGGCGFDAGQDCTNPDANETSFAILAVVAIVVFAFLLTVAMRALIHAMLRPTRSVLPGHRGTALAFTLAVIPGVVGGTSLLIAGRYGATEGNGAIVEVLIVLVPLFLVTALATWVICLRRLAIEAPWGTR